MKNEEHLTDYENLPIGLEKAVLIRVHVTERHSARVAFFSLAVLGLGALVGFVPSALYLHSSFIASGFYQYLSLAFSDASVLSSYGSELFSSLTESLPVLALALTLALVGIFLWSARRATRDARIAFFKFKF